MQFAGRESWQVSRGSSLPVDVALYLRDVLALSVDTQPFVPSLDPPVPVAVPAGVDRAAVTREWPGWWADILEWCRTDVGSLEPRERLRTVPVADTSPALAHRPALRAALAVLTEPAARYQSALARPPVPPDLAVNEVVDELERELGRRVKPFRFRITEVRVRESMWEPLTATHVLAAQRFVESPAVRPALREALLPLA
jgi:hypothetical protein